MRQTSPFLAGLDHATALARFTQWREALMGPRCATCPRPRLWPGNADAWAAWTRAASARDFHGRIRHEALWRVIEAMDVDDPLDTFDKALFADAVFRGRARKDNGDGGPEHDTVHHRG